MSLMPCRACGHQVDTSALACPGCGATDPAKKISRQERNFYFLIVNTVVWICVLSIAGWFALTVALPWAKQMINKPAVEQRALTPPPQNDDE